MSISLTFTLKLEDGQQQRSVYLLGNYQSRMFAVINLRCHVSDMSQLPTAKIFMTLTFPLDMLRKNCSSLRPLQRLRNFLVTQFSITPYFHVDIYFSYKAFTGFYPCALIADTRSELKPTFIVI